MKTICENCISGNCYHCQVMARKVYEKLGCYENEYHMEQLTLHDKATLSLCRFFAKDRDKLVLLLCEADTDACKTTIKSMIQTLDDENLA